MALIGETDMVGNFAVVSAHTGRTNSTKRKVEEWLNLEEAASVEVSSEDPQHPIESVFKHGESLGWRADESGAQKIRLLFDEPKDLRRIWLRFSEPHRDVVGVQIPLGEQLFDVAQRQGKAQVPSHRQQDDLRLKLPPLE